MRYAVDDLMQGADDWNAGHRAAVELKLRIGAAVASGRLIFGAVGDESRLEYTVIGDAVNLAAKLEKATKDRAFDGVDAPMDLVVLTA